MESGCCGNVGWQKGLEEEEGDVDVRAKRIGFNMIVYVLMWIWNITAYVVSKKLKKGNRIYLAVMMTILFAISSLRSKGIGGDYVRYASLFDSIVSGNIGLNYGFEKGYMLLNLILAKFTDQYVFLGMSVNVIIFGSLYRYIYTNVASKYYVLVVYVFLANPYLYIQSTFNILRQGCATAILLTGICFLYERKWVKYCLVVLMAAQFHKSVYIVGLLLFIIRKINWTQKKFLIFVVSTAIINIVIQNDQILYKIASVFGYGGYIGYKKTEFDFLLYILFVVLVVLFFLSFYPRLCKDEKAKFFLDIYLAGLSMLPLFVLNDIVYRIYIFFVFVSLPAIPIIWNAFKEMGRERNYYVVAFGYSIYYIFFSIMFFCRMAEDSDYVPFRFFWQI